MAVCGCFLDVPSVLSLTLVIEVEEQRRYLGGDGDHSILVKGLDVALLEQNKARGGLSTEDDESLEQAFLEVASGSTNQKRKTREDLIRELKEKREKGEIEPVGKTLPTIEEEAQLLEAAKKAGRFKPIGASADDKSKRKKVKEKEKDGGRKKKRKVDIRDVPTGEANVAKPTNEIPSLPLSPPPPPPKAALAHPLTHPTEPESEPTSDFEIFAGAGEYKGLDLDDEDDEDRSNDQDQAKSRDASIPLEDKQPAGGRWFATESTEAAQTTLSHGEERNAISHPTTSAVAQSGKEDDEDEDERPSRLVPLESSALPSIKDLLAMDEASAPKKRRKRKGAKGEEHNEKKKVSAEVKAERDYKRLVLWKYRPGVN